MRRDTTVSDYTSLLQELSHAGQEYFLEGGQAVNFWAEYIGEVEGEETLREFQPYMSADCDIWINHAVAKYLEQKREGNLIKGTSPADGQWGVFTIAGDPPRQVDLMTGVYGIPPKKHPKLVKRSVNINDIKVLDPLYLFVGKCHCLLGLNQTDRQDEKHLRMLCLIIPSYVSHLLEEVKSGYLEQRYLVKEIKLLQKLVGTNVCRRALEQIQVNSQSLIPLDKIRQSGLLLLERFAENLK